MHLNNSSQTNAWEVQFLNLICQSKQLFLDMHYFASKIFHFSVVSTPRPPILRTQGHTHAFSKSWRWLDTYILFIIFV